MVMVQNKDQENDGAKKERARGESERREDTVSWAKYVGHYDVELLASCDDARSSARKFCSACSRHAPHRTASL